MKLPAYEALNAYNAARAAIGQSRAPTAGAEPLKASAFDAVHALASAVAEGEKASAAYLAGGADPHSVVEALSAAELAIDAAVVIRDKVVEAYQELLRMPV